VRGALLDPAIVRFVSHVSLWEIAIKRTTKKLAFSDEDIAQTTIDLSAEELLIARHHVLSVSDLPLIHRDPFDRLLIAQAKLEGLTIVTSDRQFEAYGIPVLAA
jgi:PIN domain nuclease of toxin-antitoxin system